MSFTPVSSMKTKNAAARKQAPPHDHSIIGRLLPISYSAAITNVEVLEPVVDELTFVSPQKDYLLVGNGSHVADIRWMLGLIQQFGDECSVEFNVMFRVVSHCRGIDCFLI